MLRHIGVIGGGTMGHGIAAAFALHDVSVHLYEPSAKQRDDIVPSIRAAYDLLIEEQFINAAAVPAALDRITIFDELAPAVNNRHFIVEAIPERMELKQALFAELDRLCPATTIFATNTSSLPLAPMIAGLPAERRGRFLVTHWYNPPLIMPLVEISAFGNTTVEIYDAVAKLHQTIGKRTAKILKDIPGLVANRIQQAVAREVFSLIAQGAADAADIDTALKFGPAFRYATTGQLEVADFGGLDIWLTVGDNLLAAMDASREASPLLRQKVAEGKLGIKTGEGFYVYDRENIPATRRAFLKRLVKQLKASSDYS
ncbi:3-hydroxyacyl-CoA dehydrogenase NAD-binding domain-containing protein [Bradyrhizobium sp. 1]|uniref:3-hydroxyacyl-CoA dehydrogenase family protein n=1 Tax=Bradyrhizobium sp. 1 TaxID=241591 RepID=UPI001FF79955|nr:3-hydroxyacyl-CoA dehydrogenase NAD-binding domain-containing protein [Bradyrhizobium sp. 1]MCK1394354.1 3-hydroxyacyl-CoA dehydrogenase family protein [Bradyrhizobium sp. 1]